MIAVEKIPSWIRAAEVILGLVSLVAGVTMGAAGKHFSTALRGLSVGVGVLSIILAAVFLALPALAVVTLVVLLSLGLLITGLESIAVGVIGRKIVPVMANPVKV